MARGLAGALGLVVGMGGFGGTGARVGAEEGFETVVGPLIQTFPLSLEPGERLEAAGPFYYRQRTEDGGLWAVPPVVSAFRSTDGDREHWYVMPPVFSSHRYGQDRKWELLQVINGSHVDSMDSGDLKRWTLFPFFMYQDAPDDARDYWAFLPIYGKLQRRLFRDEIEFAMFPLWLKSRKGTMTTRNYLFPFVHFREGPGLKGWQFLPLAGHEHLEPGTRTNTLDEVEVVPGHDKVFALWPVYHRDRLGLGTPNPAKIDAAIPFYYQERSPERDHTAVVWPFVSWTDNRKEKFRQWNAPWPLVGFAHGEGKTLDRVLPFFSVGHTKEYEARSYLWPVYRRQHLHASVIDRDRRQWLMWLYSDLRETNRETGKAARRVDSWPLFCWSRDPEGRERTQVLALFEPFNKSTGIVRNWSPVWSLWREERNPVAGSRSESLLWNLYRREVRAGVTNGSLLFGLVQYEKSADGRRWRWFHVGPRLPGQRRQTESASNVPEHR